MGSRDRPTRRDAPPRRAPARELDLDEGVIGGEAIEGEVIVIDRTEPRAEYRSEQTRRAPVDHGEERYPMVYEVKLPGRLDRRSTALRLFYLIPLALFVIPLLAVIALGMLAGWIAVIGTRTYPRWLYGGLLGALSFVARVEAYALLLTDRYPSFGEQKSAVALAWAEPPDGRLSPWRVGLWKTALLVPQFAVLVALSVAQLAVTIAAWVAILRTSRLPEEIFSFSTGVNRWRYRVLGYYASFNDRVPPFSPWSTAGPAAPVTVAACAAAGLVAVGIAGGALLGSSSSSGRESQEVAYAQLLTAADEGSAWTFAAGTAQRPTFVVTLRALRDPDEEAATALRLPAENRAVEFILNFENLMPELRDFEDGSVRLRFTDHEGDHEIEPFLITAAGRAVPTVLVPGEEAVIRATFIIPAQASVTELRLEPPWQSGGIAFRFH
jgi:hypothetical protein